MTRWGVVPLAIGTVAALVLAGAALLAPLDLRHSAPFGFRLAFDARRGIAVSGAFVEPNYPNFDRVDLDLRAYAVEEAYDLTVHVRPDRPGAVDARTIPLPIDGATIRHDKPTFSDPFVTVRFPPIADSAGKRYYVWVERGPRNRDQVLALWSVKSYSRGTGGDVLAAFLRPPGGAGRTAAASVFLAGLLVAVVVAFGWLVAALIGGAFPAARSGFLARSAVANREGRWYTLAALARRPRRRVVTFGTCGPRPGPTPPSEPSPPSTDRRQLRQRRD